MEYGLYLENMLRSNHLYSSMVYAAMIFTTMQMRNRHRFARVELDAMNGLMDSYGSCYGDDGIYRHFKGESMLVPYPWDQCWSSHAVGIDGWMTMWPLGWENHPCFHHGTYGKYVEHPGGIQQSMQILFYFTSSFRKICRIC